MSRHPLFTSIFKITPCVSDNERGDIDIEGWRRNASRRKQWPPSSHTDPWFHTHSSHHHQVVSFLTHMIRDDTLRDPDDPLKAAGKPKIIRHCYRKLYVDRQETIVSHCEHFIGSLRLVSGLYTVDQFFLLNSVSNSVWTQCNSVIVWFITTQTVSEGWG